MQRKIIIALIIIFTMGFIGLAYIIYESNTEVDMSFPGEAGGQEYIAKTPVITQESNGTVKINWSLLKKCKENYIYIQEENPKYNSEWSVTGDNNGCNELNGLYTCEAVAPEGLISGKKYFAQINSGSCGDDTGIRGSVFSFIKK